jgi:hypothetical protein
MQNLKQKKADLVKLMEDFISKTLHGCVRGAWKTYFILNGVKLEDLNLAESFVRPKVTMFLADYFNEGVRNMVTNGPDPYFMEEFTKMKEVLNHGYRCLLIIMFNLTQLVFGKMNLNQLKFDLKKWEFTNYDEILEKIFEKTRKTLIDNVSHKCDNSNEDITKWDPEEKLFLVKKVEISIQKKQEKSKMSKQEKVARATAKQTKKY